MSSAPLFIKSKLHGTPKRAPRYAATVKTKDGKSLAVGCPMATRGLLALMNLHAVNGGAACHWGGPSAYAEIMSAIHGIMFSVTDKAWYEAFNFVNDAGHAENGIYALRANLGFGDLSFEDLKGFRSIESKLTGHGESHIYPEGVLLSNGPLGSSFPQSQGLALADKLMGNQRVTICVLSDGASMEGEARESFAAIAGLGEKGKLNPYVLVISDNNTKLSGRIDADAFSMTPSLATLPSLGWNVIHVKDGHNLQKVYSAIEQGLAEARLDPKTPVCIHVKTIKGYGVKSTEESASGGHGYPLKDGEKIVDFIEEIFMDETPEEFMTWAKELHEQWKSQQALPKAGSGVKTDKVQAGLAKGAIRAKQEGFPVYSVCCDVQGSTGIAAFQKMYPHDWIEVGIAESNMLSTAAGLSKLGYIPIVDAFGQFGVTKGNLPLTMAALSQAPVIGIFSHIGLQDAADGASHQATTYFSAISSIPHTLAVAPCCFEEADHLMHEAITRTAKARSAGEDGESVIFFVGRENYPISTGAKPVQWGKVQVLREGKDVLIVATGVLVFEALKAADELAKLGVQATVVNNPFVNRPDAEGLKALLAKNGGKLLTAEDHQVLCGMGAQVVHALALSGAELKAVSSLGIKGEFGQSAYKASELYALHHLDCAAIVKSAQELAQK